MLLWYVCSGCKWVVKDAQWYAVQGSDTTMLNTGYMLVTK